MDFIFEDTEQCVLEQAPFGDMVKRWQKMNKNTLGAGPQSMNGRWQPGV